MKKQMQVGKVECTVTEAVAAQAMWEYYKQHRALLIADIREYRDYILARLMQGASAAQVFAQFLMVVELVPVPCKSTSARARTKVCKLARSPWPFIA